MKKVALFICMQASLSGYSQTTPDKIYGSLFTAVQESTIFTDSKTFVDAIPKKDAVTIMKNYQSQSKNGAFSLQDFVLENFTL